ncbi:MAG: hypothetical protein AAF928_12705 [Myxococcota bacterium]
MSDDRDPLEDLPADDESRRKVFERAVPEVFRRVLERAVESGLRGLAESPGNLRDVVQDMKLPKEAAQVVYEQLDDTKKGLYRVFAKEIRDVLEHINFADEFADVLTKLQFEVNTTVRFVPNQLPAGEDEDDDGKDAEDEREPRKRPSRYPRPKVVSKVVMKARDAYRKTPKDG